MQIKRIADNIRAFSFLVTNWNKEPDEERIYRWTEFFHNSPVKLWFSIKLIATGFFFQRRLIVEWLFDNILKIRQNRVGETWENWQ